MTKELEGSGLGGGRGGGGTVKTRCTGSTLRVLVLVAPPKSSVCSCVLEPRLMYHAPGQKEAALKAEKEAVEAEAEAEAEAEVEAEAGEGEAEAEGE